MTNQKLWKALNCTFDPKELKALEKEDPLDFKGPRTVAEAGPRSLTRKSRLKTYLESSTS